MKLVIGAPHGRSGKTTVTLGLILALRQKGWHVQPFKKGPDFIDPSWLSLVAGRDCRNLDLYFMEHEKLRHHFAISCGDADIAVVEGAMGLYDGLDFEGTDSTAAVARAIKAPIILVVDATRMTRSAAALVKGFQNFEEGTEIAAVILNKVARPRHEEMLRRSIEDYTGIPVVGAIPKQKNLVIADRHLGLVPAVEMERTYEVMDFLQRSIADSTDLESVLSIARSAESLPVIENHSEQHPHLVRIGVIRDKVFSFYYPENLEALSRAGAELVYIDSLRDETLPDIDGLYIGGGFPEVFGAELEQNVGLKAAIRKAAATGMPIYAECGGVMYLSRRLHYEGRSFEMCGVLPCDTKMSVKPKGHGYSAMNTIAPNYLFPVGALVRGHEFHHSQIINYNAQEIQSIYQVERGYGLNGKIDGIIQGNVIASYTHIYAGAHPEWAVNFTAKAAGMDMAHTVGL
jgi:cobyrinic acid a,c-diamide synthase